MQQDVWKPEQYEKYKQERSQPFYDLMNLLETPRSRIKVMDLGCGTAELHHHLRADQTTGMDFSEQMLNKAQTFAENNLNFIRGDIRRWSPTDNYDFIFSNAALQWCSDHPALFARLKKVLSAGGQLAVQMPMNHDYPTHVIAAQMSQAEPWKDLLKESFDPQSTMLSAEDYASLMFQLGFQQQKIFVRVYGHVLDSREDVIECVKGTTLTRFEKQLSPQDYTKFLAEYKQRLFAELPDQKPFFYPFKRILIWGRL